MNLQSRIWLSSLSCSGIHCDSEGLTAAAELIKQNPSQSSPAKNNSGHPVDILCQISTLERLSSREDKDYKMD